MIAYWRNSDSRECCCFILPLQSTFVCNTDSIRTRRSSVQFKLLYFASFFWRGWLIVKIYLNCFFCSDILHILIFICLFSVKKASCPMPNYYFHHFLSNHFSLATFLNQILSVFRYKILNLIESIVEVGGYYFNSFIIKYKSFLFFIIWKILCNSEKILKNIWNFLWK